MRKKETAARSAERSTNSRKALEQRREKEGGTVEADRRQALYNSDAYKRYLADWKEQEGSMSGSDYRAIYSK